MVAKAGYYFDSEKQTMRRLGWAIKDIVRRSGSVLRFLYAYG